MTAGCRAPIETIRHTRVSGAVEAATQTASELATNDWSSCALIAVSDSDRIHPVTVVSIKSSVDGTGVPVPAVRDRLDEER